LEVFHELIKVVTEFTSNFDQFVKDFEHMDLQMTEVVHTVSQVAVTNTEMNQSIERLASISAQVQSRMVSMTEQVGAVASKSEHLQEMLAALRTGNTPFDSLVNILGSLQHACIKLLLKARNEGVDILDQQY